MVFTYEIDAFVSFQVVAILFNRENAVILN